MPCVSCSRAAPAAEGRTTRPRVRRLLLAAPFLLALLAAGCGSERPAGRSDQSATTQRVVLISWDGAQERHVREAMARGILPNLSQLVGEGGMAPVKVAGHMTETLVSHVEMLTGYPPSVTGVTTPKAPDRHPVPAELFVFERLNQVLGADNVFQVWVTSKDWRMGAHPGDPFYLTRGSVDIFDGNRDRPARVTGPRAVECVRRAAQSPGALFAFIHFREPDVAGHAYGENSPEYDLRLAEVDYWLGQIRHALSGPPSILAPAAIVVTTDHGFREDGHDHVLCRRAWLATNWGQPTWGEQADVAPTIYAIYGIHYRQFEPALPGRSLLAGDG
jgi:predicted AlkP superfamily pyrophosphatase or phosphodiesterase